MVLQRDSTNWGRADGSDNGEESQGFSSVHSDAESGTSDGTMRLWTLARRKQLSRIANADFTNNSGFDTPSGLAPTNSEWGRADGSDDGWEDGFWGHYATGTILDPNGNVISGIVSLQWEGGIGGVQKQSNGTFGIDGPAPEVILQGANADTLRDIKLVYEPQMNAMNLVVDAIGQYEDIGRVRYGGVTGTVKDYTGETLENEAVAGPGAGDITDENGNFSLNGPGGQTVTFEALERSYTFDETLVSGSTTNIDIQYPRLAVEVVDADYQPVEGAPVQIGEATFKTDESGRVELDAIPLGTYHLKVMDKFEIEQATVDAAGEEIVYRLGPGPDLVDWGVDSGIGGVKINCFDAETGEVVQKVSAVDRNSGASSASGPQGICKILTTDTQGTVDILVAGDDRRYRSTQLAGELPEDEMLEFDVELEKRTQVINT